MEFPATVHTANGCREGEGEGDREGEGEGDFDGFLVPESEDLGDFDTDGDTRVVDTDGVAA